MNKLPIKQTCVFLGALVLMLASMGCTGWFFYSLLGGGNAGIVGAAVGCAVQAVAYGFSAYVAAKLHWGARSALVFLTFSALGLSMLSTYATLKSYIERNDQYLAEQSRLRESDQAYADVINASLKKLADSANTSAEINSLAAKQAIESEYRTQAKGFIEGIANDREEMKELIKLVSETRPEATTVNVELPEASPMQGIADVLGGKDLAIVALCLWLALMFDGLPVASIYLLSRREAETKEQDAIIEETIANDRNVNVESVEEDYGVVPMVLARNK